MAVVIPLIAVYGGVTAGMAVAAGAALTIGSALAIAGGMAAGLGIISGRKDFQRLGSVLGAMGGIANAVQGAAGAASGTDASSAWDAADSAAGSDAAQFGKYANGADAGTVGEIGNVGQVGYGNAADAVGATGTTGIDAAGNVQAPMDAGQATASSLTGGADAPSLAETFQTAPVAPTAQAAATPAEQALSEAASNMTRQDISAMLERGSERAGSLFQQAFGKVGEAAGGVGNWIKSNPQAAQMLMQGIGSAYSPEAEAADYQRSIYERARRNLNSPIRLQYRTPNTTGA